MNEGGSEREADTESEAGSRLWAVSTEPDVGLELTDREIMTWAEVRCLTKWATQAHPPLLCFLIQLIGMGLDIKWQVSWGKQKMLSTSTEVYPSKIPEK